jgi:two-component system nitrate/nitrite response regulator NarL
MAETITFAAVDEHPLFRQGLVQSLQRTEGLVCIAEGETAADARRIAALQKPDILILEVLVRGGGIAAARAILSAHRNTKVLILTASDDEVHLTQALKAGVRGYALKGISGSELVEIIRSVHAGQPYIAPALSAWFQRAGKAAAGQQSDGTLASGTAGARWCMSGPNGQRNCQYA